ncbi:MAG: ATP-binding protein [Saprospiraceae bacterium]
MSRLSLLFLFFAPALVAQTSAFEKITIEDGLSQGMIYDLCQTRDGFLWIATKDGLNRYDGYNFKVFSNDPFDPFSLAENTVISLFEDSRGWLWIGTESKGLDVYDPKTGRFHHFNLSAIEISSVIKIESGRIRETPDGNIWAIRAMLAQIAIPESWRNGLPDEPDLGRLTQVTPFPIALSKKPGEDWLVDFARLKNGELMVTSKHEQFVVDTRAKTYRAVNQGLLPQVINRFEVADGPHTTDVWMGGIHEIRRIRNGQVTSFFTKRTTFEVQRMLLIAGQNGHIWVIVNNHIWDISPGEDIDFANPDFVSDLPPSTLKGDKNGNLWVGTLGYGLRKINPAKTSFHVGAAGTSISGLWRDPAGRYFCKSYVYIYPYDPKTGQVSQSYIPDALDNQINMVFGPTGESWLLCRDFDMGDFAALRRFDANRKLVKSYTFEAKLNLFDQLISSRDGHLWVSGYGCQMLRFDPRTGQTKTFSFAHLFGEKASIVRTIALAETPDGILWAGTQLGLVKCVPNAQGFDFQLIQADANNRQGLNNNSIACILPDTDGSLWLGTKGGGINILNPKTGLCRHITTADGLLNNVVYGILPGSRAGEFWCSTNRGLAKIMVRKSEPLHVGITTFTAAVGLQDNEFNTNAFFKADNGELLFGGVNGLNRFFPDELRADTTPPPVFLVNIEINYQKGRLASPVERLARLELRHDQNNVSFEFAALDFADPSKNRYRYRLVGLDRDWVETGNLRFAHFNHLAPGRYELRVQGSNGESAWREAQPLTVVVLPPWWRSDLAYLCYFLGLVWAGWRAYRFQIRRVKEREQLAFEQRETERVRALEQLKTNFFSNVTHEFRTPLTLMIEPLRRVLPKIKDPEILENVALAERNSRQLLGLVNQLLDMAKLESGSMSLDLRRANLGEVVRRVFESFAPLAEKRGVALTLENWEKTAALEFDLDPNKVELVLNNLISNALKFTPPGGQVKTEVEAAQTTESTNPQINIKISDTGIGIPPEVLGRVFDRFYQVDGSHTRAGEGTGIGLALSKELAELMGGSLTVESEPGKGSTFIFSLPMRIGEAANRGTEEQLAAEPTPPQAPHFSENDAAGGEKPLALVIEDNSELRLFIKKSIGEKWQVAEAADGEEGVKKATELVPDLVISDVMMPRKDGFAVLDELKNAELTAHIPVILLTAKSGIESKLSGLRRGADDYLTKPFSTEELLARMENLVETRRRLRQLFGQQVAASVAVPEPILPESPDDFLCDPDREFLKKLGLIVEANLGNAQMTIEDVAAAMFVSRSQLHRKLDALTGQNTSEFVRNYRLDRAHAMLKNREGRVGEVALRVGFGSEKYFSTAFRERFGVPPSQV